MTYCRNERFAVEVQALVFHPDPGRREVLALRQAKNSKWAFPGGQYEIGQPQAGGDRSLEDAFDRGLRKETQLYRDPNMPLDIITFYMFTPRGRGRCARVARVIGKTQVATSEIELDDDHDDFIWTPSSQLGALALESVLRDVLPGLIDQEGGFITSPKHKSGLLLPLGYTAQPVAVT